ncbi:MAG: helix-turn-helix domain-containing protein [Thermoanaerobaculia bacterium]
MRASEPIQQEISTGQAVRILKRSYSTVYRLIEAGVLHPVNGLHPAMRGKRKHVYRFDLEEVRRVRAVLAGAEDGGE